MIWKNGWCHKAVFQRNSECGTYGNWNAISDEANLEDFILKDELNDYVKTPDEHIKC